MTRIVHRGSGANQSRGCLLSLEFVTGRADA
jgi:hypothetical protein